MPVIPDWCGFMIRSFHRGHLIEKKKLADLGKGFRSGAFRLPSVASACDLAVGTILEAKWLPEIDVQNRLQGDIAWLKIGLSVPF